jgi:hypothetical protein
LILLLNFWHRGRRVYASFMQKSGGFARTVHPISAAASKPKAWTKLADRALGGAVAAVGVVFLFHPAPWFIYGIVITAVGLLLLIAALFVGLPESPAPAPGSPPGPEGSELTEMIKKAHCDNDSLTDVLEGKAKGAADANSPGAG